MNDDKLVEAMARAIDAELGKREMVLTSPQRLAQLRANRCASAALAAYRAHVGVDDVRAQFESECG